MKRLNLQLFATKFNTSTSIVDYLKSVGTDSSYSNRSKLAKQYGISNYTGTAAQNTKLLNLMKNASASTSTASKNSAGSGVAAAQTASKNTVKNGSTTENAANSNKNTSGSSSGNTNSAVEAAKNVVNAASSSVDTPASTSNVATVLPNDALGIYVENILNGNMPVEAVPDIYKDQVYESLLGKSFPSTPSGSSVSSAGSYSKPTYSGPTSKAQKATSIEERLDADTLAALKSQFQVSEAYQQAMDYTNKLLQQLSGGKTTYTDQISQLIADFQNREKFSYDASNDALFQQMLASSMDSGRTAMQDTMGQAAALTGGYGSTYSQAAGNNAYNQYVQEAYNNLPEYYQLALDAYNQEGQNMLNELSVLNDADAKEYDRLYNAYSANLGNAQSMYEKEFNEWQSKVNNAYNYAGMLNSDYWNKMDYDENVRQYENNFEYQKYLDELAQKNWQESFDYQKAQDALAQNNWQTEFDYAKEQDALAQKNWQTSFDYNKSQDALAQKNYENEFAYQKEQDALAQSNWQTSFDYNKEQDAIEQNNWEKQYLEGIRQYNSSLAEDKRQFDASLAEEQRQYNTSYSKKNSSGTSDDEEFEYKTPTQKMYTEAAEAYNAGGEAGLEKYLETAPDYDIESLYDYATKHGEVAMEARTYTKVKDTTNWFWGVDNNDIVRDESTGKEYKIKDLPDSIQKTLTNLKKGETYDFSTNSKVTKK